MGGRQSKQVELRRALDGQLAGSGVSALSRADQDEVLDVLSRAFIDDPFFTWVACLDDDDPKRLEKMLELNRSLFPYVVHPKSALQFGIKGTNDELAGCMSVTSSAKHKERLLDMLQVSIKHGIPPMYKSKSKNRYGTYAAKRLDKLVPLTKTRANHMKDTKGEWAYLQSIGVRPEHHGKGHGKRMLNLLTRTADAEGMALYLETESEQLESMYQRFGFRTLEKVNVRVPGDTSKTATLILYLMRRDPIQ